MLNENACSLAMCFESGGRRYLGGGISCGLYTFSGQLAHFSSSFSLFVFFFGLAVDFGGGLAIGGGLFGLAYS